MHQLPITKDHKGYSDESDHRYANQQSTDSEGAGRHASGTSATRLRPAAAAVAGAERGHPRPSAVPPPRGYLRHAPGDPDAPAPTGPPSRRPPPHAAKPPAP